MEQNEIEKVEQNKIGMSKNQDHCCLLEKKPNMVIDGCENKVKKCFDYIRFTISE